MTKIAVLGLGNWGTALAHHLAGKGHDLLGWTIEQSIADGINTTHKNPSALSDISLHPGLKATREIAQCLDAEVTLLAVPSRALDHVVPLIKNSRSKYFVSAIKGIEEDSALTPLQFIEKALGKSAQSAVLSGPSFARDVVLGKPAGLVAASKSEECARAVAELFSSDTIKVYISTDPLGVELGGIVKNVIAIAAGVSDGLKLGDSARAGLITRGLAEMVRLAEAMGADRMTLFGLSGLGDLAMTASSDLSRNRVVGLRLGQGERLDQIITSLGSVAEGVTTAPLVLELAKRHNVDMPITQHVVDLLCGKDSPQNMARSLISRPIKREF